MHSANENSTTGQEVNPLEKKRQIEKLARQHHQASELLNVLGLMNTPQDPLEREESAIQFALARAEFYRTRVALENAIVSP